MPIISRIGAMTSKAWGQFKVAVSGIGNYLYFWGANSSGEFGNNDQSGNFYNSPLPVAPDQTAVATPTFLAGSFSISLRTNGAMFAAGRNDFGALGIGTTVNQSVATQIGTLTTWRSIDVSDEQTLALKSDGTLWSWGDGTLGNIGNSTTNNYSSPVQVGTNTNWASFSTNNYTCFAITTTGQLWAWGNGGSGSLGDGAATDKSSPVQIGTLTNWSKVAAGNSTTYAIKTDGTLWAWGSGSAGKVGDSTVISRSSPVQIGTLTNWSNITATQNTAYALSSAGSLWSWGTNTSGALGLNIASTINRSSPSQIGTLTTWATLGRAKTGNFASAIKTDGTLWAWGANASGQLGDRSVTNRSSPVQIGAENEWLAASNNNLTSFYVDIGNNVYYAGSGSYGQTQTGYTSGAVGSSNYPFYISSQGNWGVMKSSGANTHTSIVRGNGSLWSWGSGLTGGLGDGTTIDKSSPVQIGALTNWRTTSSGNFFTLALKRDSTLWSWGTGGSGQLGSGTTLARSSPVQVGSSNTNGWFTIATGYRTGYAIDGARTFYSWGLNSYGQIGDGSTNDKSTPTAIGAATDWYQINAGYYHALAIRATTGQLWAWGANDRGQVGDGTTVNRSSPVQVGTLTGWTSIAGGFDTSYAIKGGALWAWGLNSNGQLGDSTTVNKSSPIQIGTLTNWLYVDASSEAGSGFAIKTDGTLWAWGANNVGQLGIGNIENKSSPTQVGTLTTWSSIINGDDFAGGGLNNNASLYMWGSNAQGQLAQNTVYFGLRSSPVQLGTEKWLVVSGQANTIAAIKSDNSLWGWGAATSGQIGDNTTINKSSPVQIGTLTNWSSAAGIQLATLAVDTSGQLWAWGNGANGRLGLGDTLNRSSPVQIGTLTDWSGSLSGYSHALAVKTNGTLWSWGLCNVGQLGEGLIVNRSSPVQIGTLSNWQKVAANATMSAAIKTDGTLWTWGVGSSGEIGNGTTLARSSPVQVGTLNTWRSVACLGNANIAVKTDNTLWAWGTGANGVLGDGTTINKSSPIQIGTLTTWSSVLVTGASSGGAIKTDGTLWTWGFNGFGDLGNMSTISRSSPVQVGTLTTWTSAGSVRTSTSYALSSA